MIKVKRNSLRIKSGSNSNLEENNNKEPFKRLLSNIEELNNNSLEKDNNKRDDSNNSMKE